ncbi:MAG: preprotein translocase subunit SecG [Peptostreptococcaceae bacterium]|nr:preprotein translocase subunit SecG [Peptostreptococcaceae bacterium]
MKTALLVIEVAVSILLIISVLLQSGNKGGFGVLSGASDHLAGNQSQGADSIYKKMTAVLGTIFLVLSIALVAIY